ncbi:MAG: HDOD domain-containing protein [Pseudomonadota bacterium]
MPAPDISPFPLLAIEAVADGRNAWTALLLRVDGSAGDEAQALARLLAYPDLFAALAPLDAIVRVANSAALTPALLQILEAQRAAPRLVFALPARAYAEPDALARCQALQAAGCRFMQDGELDPALPSWLGGQLYACIPGQPVARAPRTPGPHLAHGVADAAQQQQCREAGFDGFSGSYALQAPTPAVPGASGSRKHMLALLGMLAREAEVHEIEIQLKQDPALSFQLLRLANSAAQGLRKPVSNFGQAIMLLGRRQMQRWLQLLLYARAQADGLPNLLLPLAALRAAQMEMLCKLQGGNADEQDRAFMAGVFSLLDVLLGMPMGEVVAALGLPSEVGAALMARHGRLGHLLQLAEARAPDHEALRRAEADPESLWRSQLQGYHWAIQVSRNL